MARKPTDFDFAKALLDPAASFAEPGEIVSHPGLSHEQKLQLLRQWERDAWGLTVAEGEGMAGGEENMLARVRHAIRLLDAPASEDPTPPARRHA